MEDVAIWPEGGITGLDSVGGEPIESIRDISAGWHRYRQHEVSAKVVHSLQVQLAREWAIETGAIEGLYEIERGVTQTLIEEGITLPALRGATNRPSEEVFRLLEDHQDVLEGLFDFVKDERPLTVGYIQELHQALTRSQAEYDVRLPDGTRSRLPLHHGQWKTLPNHPSRAGKRYLYCPPEQTDAQMRRLVELFDEIPHAGTIPPEASAAWLHHRFTQIHPFEDGNGRVARALASIVLIKGGLFPMVVPTDEKPVYLDALEAADQGNLRPLKLVIARRQWDQFRRIVHELSQRPIEDMPAELAVRLYADKVRIDPPDVLGATKERALRGVNALTEVIQLTLLAHISSVGLDGTHLSYDLGIPPTEAEADFVGKLTTLGFPILVRWRLRASPDVPLLLAVTSTGDPVAPLLFRLFVGGMESSVRPVKWHVTESTEDLIGSVSTGLDATIAAFFTLARQAIE